MAQEERNLRFHDESQTVQSVAQNADSDLEAEKALDISEKVDYFFELKEKLEQERKRLKPFEREYKEMKEELEKFARDNDKRTLSGEKAVVEFSDSSAKSIDPAKFLKFLKKLGKAKAFYGYVKVGVTNACKDFGEKVLEKNGVLKVDTKDYGNMRVFSKELS
jgi:hypothetical protein